MLSPPPPLPPAPPLLPLLLAITHGDLTPARGPSSLGPSWSRRSSPGLPPLCWVQNRGHSENFPHSLLGSMGGALLLPIVKCLKCNAPPSLAEDRLSWHRGSQTGHQGHTEKANSLPVASPSTLGDQIHLMVKGLAGLAARISESWGPTVRSCASPRTGPRAAELHRRRHSFRSAFHMDVFERQKKKVFLFSFLGVSAIVLVSSLPFLWNCV